MMRLTDLIMGEIPNNFMEVFFMKKWKVKFIAEEQGKVVTTETRTYKTKHNAELAVSKQIYDMFVIDYDTFEVTRKGENGINVLRKVFRGCDINYLWTIEEL
jgi:hypothetical protein